MTLGVIGVVLAVVGMLVFGTGASGVDQRRSSYDRTAIGGAIVMFVGVLLLGVFVVARLF